MLTVQKVEARAERLDPYLTRPGAFVLRPFIKLRCITDRLEPDIKKGEIVTATGIDKYFRYPNTVHLQEYGFWWKVKHFEFAE